MEIFKVIYRRWSPEDRQAFQDELNERYPMFFCFIDWLIAGINGNNEKLQKINDDRQRYEEAGMAMFNDP